MFPTAHGVVSQGGKGGTPPEPSDAYAYYRLLFRLNNGHSNVQVRELELRATVGGPSIATGGAATASTAFSGFPASNAFDGNRSTLWASNNGDVANAWLQYQLPAAAAIAEYAIVPGTETSAPQEWKLQGSNDGSTWETLDHRAGEGGWGEDEERDYQPQGYAPNPSAYRYWRLRITANNGDARVGTRQLGLRTGVGGQQAAVSGTPAASSQFSGAYIPSAAFGAGLDGNGWLSSGGVPQWLQYDFGAEWPQEIVQYSVAIAGASGPANKAPRDWVLEASDNLSTWVTIDSVIGQTSWGTDEIRVFTP